ncbi:hypothetical protein GC197_03270 [bacterium]|nr:hypothetical protein [bacterium]
MSLVLAVWMAARANVWTTWQGWLRAGIYTSAWAYGNLLEKAYVQFYNNPKIGLHLPQSMLYRLGDVADLLVVQLLVTWVMVPFLLACWAELATTNDSPTTSRRFSIAAILGFIAAVAVCLGMFQFLTSDYGATLMGLRLDDRPVLLPSLSGYRIVSVWETFVSTIPSDISYALAAIVILFGLSRRWGWAFVVLPVAIVVQYLLSKYIGETYAYITGNTRSNVLWDIRQVIFASGPLLTVWIALGAARLLGVKAHFGRRQEEAIENEKPVSPLDAKMD